MMTSKAEVTISPVLTIFIVLPAMLAPWAGSESLHSGEYCDTEVFRAECPENEVIILENATYGRMKVGRCVEISLGHLGCKKNVIQTADRRCSGKRVCEIRIPDAEFESFKPCLKELKTYLDASYRCVRVEAVTTDYCKAHDHLNVTSLPSGYIASIVTSDTPHCEGSTHPWVIAAQPGQHVNLTLYDFALDRMLHTTTSPAVVPCVQYGLIEDNGYDRPIPLCSASRRVFALYRSIGNVVKIWATAGSAPTDLKRFVIHYSVFGCADPIVEENMQFIRESERGGIMKCRFTDATTILECTSDNKWTETTLNCTRAGGRESSVMREGNLKSSAAADAPPSAGAIDVPPVLSYGKNPAQSQRKGNGVISSKVLVFVLLVGAAVAVLAVTLIVCIVRCHRHNTKRFEPLALRKREKDVDCPTDVSKSCHLANVTGATLTEPLMGIRQQRHPVRVNGNAYEHIWQSTLQHQQHQQQQQQEHQQQQQQYGVRETNLHGSGSGSSSSPAPPVVSCKTFKPSSNELPDYLSNSSPDGPTLTDV